MRHPWMVLAIWSCGIWTDPTCAQDEGSSRAHSTMEDRLQRAQRDLDEIRSADRSQGPSYGSPGAGSGGDLFSSILELFRQPSRLLDFRPRRIPSTVPDRDTAEFLRDRR
ncbi:MAG TPA: hypothetical protein VKU80_01050 [Planctomycetota bacterium]|nr:hypothetical protein [Planctomycetota bacterium]